MRYLFDFLFFIYSLLYFPYLLIKRKWHRGFLGRFGGFSEPLAVSLREKDNIWIHAVSVGEVLLIKRLLSSLKETFPFHRIVVSTVTKTGYDVAQKTFPSELVIFAPLDFSFAATRYVKAIRPKIYIAVETEIWPNTFLALKRNRVPIILVNGRLSDKAFHNYKSFKLLFKPVLACIRYSCMQSEDDSEKIKSLGVSSEKVLVTGNMKFDDLPSGKEDKVKNFAFGQNDFPFIAGSTHPGEEEIILDVYKTLSAEFPNLRLVIAPRHVERSGEVAALIMQKGFKVLRYSQMKGETLDQKTVGLIDTIGQLKSLYAQVKLVFVGKSLVGWGGQNIIEPAFFGKPILVGSHMENFRDVMEIFLKSNALIQVDDKNELEEKMKLLLSDESKMQAMGRSARKVVEANTGATARTLTMITKVLAQ